MENEEAGQGSLLDRSVKWVGLIVSLTALIGVLAGIVIWKTTTDRDYLEGQKREAEHWDAQKTLRKDFDAFQLDTGKQLAGFIGRLDGILEKLKK